jgi:hypothetical protein
MNNFMEKVRKVKEVIKNGSKIKGIVKKEYKMSI